MSKVARTITLLLRAWQNGDEAVVGVDRPEQLVALDNGLIELSKHDERKARAIELYYYGGLTHDEIAVVLDVHAMAPSSGSSQPRGAALPRQRLRQHRRLRSQAGCSVSIVSP